MPVATNGATGPVNSSIAQRLALKSGLNVSTASVGPGGKPNWNAKVSGASKLDEEFPALGGSSLRQSSSFASVQPVPTRNHQPQSHKQSSKTFMNVTTSNPPNPVNRRTNAKPNGLGEEEFPSLGGPSRGGSNGSAWSGSGPGVKMKPIPRSKKVAPAPNLGRKVEVDESDDFHFVPLSVSRARRDSLSEKFDVKEEEVDEYSSTNKDKGKKKKKNREKDDNSNNTHLNAATFFTGGTVGHVDGGSTIGNTEDDFPSLQAMRNSLPTSTRRGYH